MKYDETTKIYTRQDHIPIGVLENGIASPDGLGLEMR